MTRRAVDSLPDSGGKVELGEDHYRHLIRVLRYKIGDKVVLFDRSGRESNAELVEIAKNSIILECSHPIDIGREPRRMVTLILALAKGEKPEWVLQKGTELGVAHFILFTAQRSVSKIRDEKLESKMTRYQKVITSALGQCGGNIAPELLIFPTINEVLPKVESSIKLLMSPEGDVNISKFVSDETLSVALLIGPEGGLTEKETNSAVSAGFFKVSFGKRILRAETAALAAAAPFLMD